MEDITALLNECSSLFGQTEEYRILKTYRTRDNRLTFDERFSINKSIERTYAPVFELLRADAPSLTESDLFFCALTFQHIETVAIAECLTVTKDAIRMRKLRLREKLPSKWFDLLFPEQKRNSSENVTSQNSSAQTTGIPLPQQSTKNAKVMKETMSFSKAVATCFSKLFTFEGRARRSEYWFFFLFLFILKGSALIIINMFNLFDDPTGQPGIILSQPSIECTIDVFIFLFGLSVQVRRLHDIDCSGWMVLLLGVVPLVLSELFTWYKPSVDALVNEEVSPSVMAGILKTEMLFIFICTSIIIAKLVLYCRPGTEGPNSFGPDPIKIIPTDKE